MRNKLENNIKKSVSFLLPLLGIPKKFLVEAGFIESYVQRNGQWGEYLYLAFHLDQFSQKSGEAAPWYKTFLLNHPRYVCDELVEEQDIVLLWFKVTDEERKTIIKPFIEGKYSEISRKYIRKHFRRAYHENGRRKPSRNWQILTKSPILRDYWEELLDVELPEGAEVWSKPEEEENIIVC